jgi:hypothetical protein
MKTFGLKLTEHGFEKDHGRTGATYRGIGLAETKSQWNQR